MTITAADFHVTNATPQDLIKLNAALTYLQNSPTAVTILQGMISNGVTINIHGGEALYHSVGNTIDWDPAFSLSITNASNSSDKGDSLGVISPSLLLIHEGVHATDPNFLITNKIQNVQYDKESEAHATIQENLVAGELGEGQRPNHGGGWLTVSDPTLHTDIIKNSDGTYSWQEHLVGGQVVVTGGTYDPASSLMQIESPSSFSADTNTLTVNNATISVASGAPSVTLVGNGNILNLANGSSATTEGIFTVNCGNVTTYVSGNSSLGCSDGILYVSGGVVTGSSAPSGETGMFNVFDILTGDEIGSASTYDGTIYPDFSTGTHTGTSTSPDLNHYLSSINLITDLENADILDVTNLRGLTGAQSTSEIWGGNLLLDSYTNNHTWLENALNNTDWSAPVADYRKLDGSDWYYLQHDYISNNNNTGQIGMFNTFNLTTGNIINLGSFNLNSASYTEWYQQDIINRAYNSSSISGGFDISDIYHMTSNNTTPTSYSGYENYIDTQQHFNFDTTSPYGAADYLIASLLIQYFGPVALDLDGDGIELVQQSESQAYYDIHDTSFKNHIGWISPDDAFLAIDLNGDGKIDQARELSFALWTPDTTDTDLDGLKAAFDTNQNGLLDSSDARFQEVLVWQDKNGNGVSEAGELKTLTEAGISSINLTSTKVDWTNGGNHLSGFSSYTKTDGSTGWTADVGLRKEAANDVQWSEYLRRVA